MKFYFFNSSGHYLLGFTDAMFKEIGMEMLEIFSVLVSDGKY